VEFLERRALGRHVDGSRLFVYKTTRNLLGWTGDTGAYVRTTLKALAKFGVCPERYWPYVIADFDQEPSSFAYAYAGTARALRYFRIDTGGRSSTDVLELVKMVLSYRYPVAFGYPVYVWGNDQGEIRMPRPGDRLMGGHAIMAVGYDDNRQIEASGPGALRIRNSWGTGWGQAGYGWLPYNYILEHLARDFWVITAQDYLND
jgi:C1A family cysteine protease